MLLFPHGEFSLLRILQRGRQRRRARQLSRRHLGLELLESRRLLSVLSYESPFGNGAE